LAHTIQENLAKLIDKCTWQCYNEDVPRKLGDSIRRYSL